MVGGGGGGGVGAGSTQGHLRYLNLLISKFLFLSLRLLIELSVTCPMFVFPLTAISNVHCMLSPHILFISFCKLEFEKMDSTSSRNTGVNPGST